MPYESVKVPAEILLEYKGYTVYRSYDHGEIENPLIFWYELEEDGDGSFDVRDLPNFGFKVTDDASRKEYLKNYELANSPEYHADVVREALEHGYLDKHLRNLGMPTPSEKEWIEDYTKLERWQLLEVMAAYSEYVVETQEIGVTIGSLSAWYPLFRAEKVGEE